jgi:hypothetical protein
MSDRSLASPTGPAHHAVPPRTEERPSRLRAKEEAGGPRHLQNVITLSSHTKQGNPEPAALHAVLNPDAAENRDPISQGDAQQVPRRSGGPVFLSLRIGFQGTQQEG